MHKNNKIWLYGKHSCITALKNSNRKCNKLLMTKEFLKENPHILSLKHNINYDIVTANIIINEISDKHATHQGIALLVNKLETPNIIDLINHNNKQKKRCFIILDQITDPHNIGAILRSAAAFAIEAVITTKDNAPAENSTLAKTASGAMEIVPYIKVTNLVKTIDLFQQHGFWSIGLSCDAQDDIERISMPDKSLIIFGSEDKGLRELTKKKCDYLAKIKMSNHIDSLNVSNAAAIILNKFYQHMLN